MQKTPNPNDAGVDRAKLLSHRRTAEVVLSIGTVHVRVLSLGETKRMQALVSKLDASEPGANLDALAAVVAFTLCDEDSRRWFADDELDQVKSIAIDHLLVIFEAATAVNHLEGKSGPKDSPPTTASN